MLSVGVGASRKSLQFVVPRHRRTEHIHGKQEDAWRPCHYLQSFLPLHSSELTWVWPFVLRCEKDHHQPLKVRNFYILLPPSKKTQPSRECDPSYNNECRLPLVQIRCFRRDPRLNFFFDEGSTSDQKYKNLVLPPFQNIITLFKYVVLENISSNSKFLYFRSERVVYRTHHVTMNLDMLFIQICSSRMYHV